MTAVGRPKRRQSPLPSPPSYRGPTRITWREAMALLGVSQGSLYAMAKAGKIPAVPVGIEGWRFHKEPLELWLKQHLNNGLEPAP